MRHLGMVHHRI